MRTLIGTYEMRKFLDRFDYDKARKEGGMYDEVCDVMDTYLKDCQIWCDAHDYEFDASEWLHSAGDFIDFLDEHKDEEFFDWFCTESDPYGYDSFDWSLEDAYYGDED